MSDNVVTLEQLRSLVKTEKVGILDLFEDPDAAVVEMQTRRRVESEIKAAKDAAALEKIERERKPEDKSADPDEKYLDPEKNPFIKTL